MQTARPGPPAARSTPRERSSGPDQRTPRIQGDPRDQGGRIPHDPEQHVPRPRGGRDRDRRSRRPADHLGSRRCVRR
ncbi:hypothetical protein ACFPRL_24705 [Pseudoclavibacter helvolus]